MKRVGYLYHQIGEIGNLKLAWYKAQKGKSLKAEVLTFRMNLDENLLCIQQQLENHSCNLGNYHFFKIFEPKERLICAASFEERVIHHAIMNILDPYFEKFQIFDSYACRKNRGVHQAVKRGYYYTKKYNYFVKMDVRKYFDSVNHSVLIKLIRKRFKDEKLLLLLEQIINSYSSSKGVGLPVGNLASQYFANYYLGFCDRFIKESLRIKGYVRYMDDMVIWGNSRSQLIGVEKKIREFCIQKLLLELRPSAFGHNSQGVPFLGFLVKPNGIYLMQKTKQRFSSKTRKYNQMQKKSRLSQFEYAQRITALVSWTKLAKAKAFRKKIFNRDSPRARTA